MTMFELAVSSLAETAATQMRLNPDTFDKDGITYCSKCHTPLQAWVQGPRNSDGERTMMLMPVRCQCVKEKALADAEKAKQADFEREMREWRRVIGMSDCKGTFDADNMAKPKITNLCRKYVRQWDKMRSDNLGILFYGSKGSGKTFFAECIVNALAERGIMTGFTTTAELVMRMQGNYDREELLEAVRNFSLLVIDDFGAERETSFGAESIYNVINIRYRVGKPTIITTNMDYTDMKNEKDITRGRIYDRVIDMCPIAVEMKGESERIDKAEKRKQKAREFLR